VDEGRRVHATTHSKVKEWMCNKTMKWFLFYVSCLNCKHYTPFGNDRFYDMGKCRLYNAYTERVRRNETECGISGKNFLRE